MAKKRIVRINQGRVLPIWLRLFISGLLFTGMFYVNFFLSEETAILLSIGLAAPILPMWNAYRIFEINNQSKVYLRGVWLAGFKFGDWKSFDHIHEIRIVNTGPTQTTRKSGGKAFGAYLVLENQEQLYLIGSNSRDQLQKWLKQIYDKLELERFN